MSWIKPSPVKVIGYGLLGMLYYCLVFIALYLTSVVLLRSGAAVDFWPLQQFQRDYYFDGVRSIWQADPGCAVIDEKLVYKPKDGKCLFRNFEFETTLTFDSYGRAVPERVNADYRLPGIAILGDSHAMGWGVNDDETFANVLQKHTKKPIFNLAVSSYATDRQLKRLITSGLIDKVDTVVIQYCDNDLSENKKQLTEIDYLEQSKIFGSKKNEGTGGALERIRYVVRRVEYAVRFPIANLKSFVRKIFGFRIEDVRNIFGIDVKINFDEHRNALSDVLMRYENILSSKKVLVFYSNAHGISFDNFPDGMDPEIYFLEYRRPKLSKRDYFLIDDHLNSQGHKLIGRFLSEALKLS